jgi:hypothetical protein
MTSLSNVRANDQRGLYVTVNYVLLLENASLNTIYKKDQPAKIPEAHHVFSRLM